MEKTVTIFDHLLHPKSGHRTLLFCTIPFLDLIIEVTISDRLFLFPVMLLESPDKGFQAAIIKRLQKAMTNSLEVNE